MSTPLRPFKSAVLSPLSDTLFVLVVLLLAGAAAAGVAPAAAAPLPVTGSALAVSPAPTPAPGAAWTKLNDPFPAPATAFGVAAFGDLGVAVVGASPQIAVSTDGGLTWSLHDSGQARYPRAIAFADALHGYAVGPGYVIATTDGGSTWARATTATGTPTSVSAAGDQVVALGPAGALVSTDGGASWQTEAVGQTDGLTSVVVDATGFAAASGSAGTLLRTPSDPSALWLTPQTPPPGVTVALTLGRQPSWGSGGPDLVAVSATGAAASDDAGQTFTSLAAPPFAGREAGQLSAALVGPSRPRLVVGTGGGLIESYGPLDGVSTPVWWLESGPLDTDVVGIAAAQGSVAYAVSTTGAVARTVSYGVTPAAIAAKPLSLTAGGGVRLTLAVTVRAPGTLVLERRPAGKAWSAMVSWPWSMAPPSLAAVTDEPLLTTSYRLRFLYHGQTTAVSRTVKVGVRPRIAVAHKTLRLRRGAVYQVTGTVFPAHPGAALTVWTDRGGRWHKIGLGGKIRLDAASAFHTRRFGTPYRETYHLRVRMAADSRHLSAASPRVTVIVR